jgi:putative transposase
MPFGTVHGRVVLGGNFRTISRRGHRYFNDSGYGREKACWTPSTIVSAAWCELVRGAMRSPPQPFSIAKASKRPMSAEPRATTRGKKINGRKRHLLVDAMGLVLVVSITAASVQDRDGAVPVLQEAHREYPTLEKVWVDGGYNGKILEMVGGETGINIEMVKRSDDMKGFVVLPKRWCVERTFGWLNRYRLLSKEYERTLESSKADIFLAMTSLMLRRLTTPTEEREEARKS